MSFVIKLLTDAIEDRIEELNHELTLPRNKEHMASLIRGEIMGLEWVLDLITEEE